MPGLDNPGPAARKVNLSEFDEVWVCGLEHVHNLAALIDDLPQWYNLDPFNNALVVI